MDLHPAPRADARQGNRALLVCALVGLVVFVGSDALASRSDWLWDVVGRGASGSENAAVMLEARAHSLAQEPPLAALVMGSSVADADFTERALAASLEVPPARVAKLWMPAMSDVELAMLAPLVRRLRPERVIVPASPFVMLGGLRWDRTRAYAPEVAWRLFTPRELFTDRVEHLSRAFASTHVIVRHRRELRRVLLGDHRDITALPPQGERPRVGEQIHALERARQGDFRCDTVHVRALEIFAQDVRATGAELIIASAPMAGRSLAGSAASSERLDACLESLSLAGARLRLGRDRPAFEHDDFRDLIHLDRAAAERFTRWVLEPAPNAGRPPHAL